MDAYYSDEQITLYLGDSLDILPTLAAESVDAIVCDPPYALAELATKTVTDALAAWLAGDRAYIPATGAGFMGRDWDRFVPPPAIWDECLRVLKPGGHLLAFAGARAVDLMGLSIRLAGFQIRDTIDWIFGSGMPKGKSQLKPAHEPIIVARKPPVGSLTATISRHGTGALNIDGCRTAGGERPLRVPNRQDGNDVYGTRLHGSLAAGGTDQGRWPTNVILTHPPLVDEHGQPVGDACANGCVPPRKVVLTDVKLGAATVTVETAPIDEVLDLLASLSARLRRCPDNRSEGTQSTPEYELLSAPQEIAPQGSLGGCPSSLRSCGERARWDLAAVQGSPRQLADVLERALDPQRSLCSTPERQDGAHLPSAGASPASTTPRSTSESSTRSPAFAEPTLAWGSPSGTDGSSSASAPERPSSGTGCSTPENGTDGSFDTTGTRRRSQRTCVYVRSLAAQGVRASSGFLSEVSVMSHTTIVPGCPVAEMDRQTQGKRASKPSKTGNGGANTGTIYGGGKGIPKTGYTPISRDDEGGASRFFPVFRYQAKAPASERPRLADGTAWPTVKPLALMSWLVRLVTPPGGTVLDPFAGTGTTLEAARLEDFPAIGVDRDPDAAGLCRVRLDKPYSEALFGDTG